MDPNGSDSDSCQLKSRHWIITDENGYERRVDGHGVAGHYILNVCDSRHDKIFLVATTSFKRRVSNNATWCFSHMG